MPQRIFLGYSSPFLPNLVEHLLANQQNLSQTLIIVPTSQSGRTLREALAAKATALLAPTILTPGALIRSSTSDITPDWIQKLAFIDSLESISPHDWPSFQPLLPEIKPTTSDWSTSLATEIVKLRSTLQEHLLDLSTAAKLLKNTTESERWDTLARIETLALKKLSTWGCATHTKFQLPTNFQKIILAGITEIPPCLSQALEKTDTPITAIIPAPESEATNFSPLGTPLDSWAERTLPKTAHLSLHANPAAQATATLEIIAKINAPSDHFAIGSPDEQTATAITRNLSENGWTAFHLAAKPPLPPTTRWLHAWKNWLAKPDSKNLAALITLPEISHFIPDNRAQILKTLNEARNRYPTISPETILHRESLTNLHSPISTLLDLHETFQKKPFPSALSHHLQDLPITDTTTFILDFLSHPILQTLKRPHSFWFHILLSELPTLHPQPPADRTLDIQGWLELLYEPAPHLIIAGMNDAFVPTKSGGEPWLSESIRKTLHLTSDRNRHARDSFLLQAMIHMRSSAGSTHLLCGKNGNTGETHIPSRLILQTTRDNLVPTVKTLFREIEPPEANLAWSYDWQWKTPTAIIPEIINVTSLRDYLACPFRFYLKNILKASATEPDRREMNNRDYGNIVHQTLQSWAEDPEAKTLTNPEKITKFLHTTLEDIVSHHFGKTPPLAVRIQTRSIRQRLEWFAHLQAQIIAEGWDILYIEHPFVIPTHPFTIKGKIDRIDQNRHTGQIRVIDYKTGHIRNVETEHRITIKDTSKIPPHISKNTPPFQSSTSTLWTNLQLPLYSLATQTLFPNQTPIPTYITLGKTQKEVTLQPWDSFSPDDLESARACLLWITSQIQNQIFWPPTEKPKYDDYSLLSPNLPLSKSFSIISPVDP